MKKVYKFTLEEDFSTATPILNRSFEAPFLKIHPNGIISIPKGYSFDGCTPKRKIFGKIMYSLKKCIQYHNLKLY